MANGKRKKRTQANRSKRSYKTISIQYVTADGLHCAFITALTGTSIRIGDRSKSQISISLDGDGFGTMQRRDSLPVDQYGRLDKIDVYDL